MNRYLAPLATLTLLASCASTKGGAPEGRDLGPDDRTLNAGGTGRGVQVIHTDQATAYDGGTRYITTLGLPAQVRVTPPDWIVNPAIDGVLGAIGVAATNDLGTREQLGEARRDGRVELANMLETRIQSVGRGDVEQYLRAVRSDGGLGHENDSKKSSLNVDRAITDLVLAGSRQRALWFDPTNGDCYVWLVMDGRVATLTDHSIENGVSIYVANQPIGAEYRPDWPKAPEAPKVEMPKPAPAPTPIQKSPTEVLEEALKPIETIPVSTPDDGDGN